LPLEAFMIRHKLPPGIFRDMSFEKWKIYFAKEHKKILDQAKGAWKAERKSISEESLESAEASEAWEASETPPSQLREQSEPFASSEGAGEGGTISEEAPGLDGRNAMIRGSDVADRSIQVAKNNRKWLKLSAHQVFFETLDAASISDLPSSGTAIINPPYGERLSLEDAAAFYKELGDIMKRSFKGWSVWVLSSNKEGLKSIGLKAARKHTLFNGPLECSFRRFDMY
ncbi:MAG: hypothetical protein KDK25_14205, partial [Leptospiraceae bacterium]|nr:hypothetical protein [Leptospiraceae bacterium]